MEENKLKENIAKNKKYICFIIVVLALIIVAIVFYIIYQKNIKSAENLSNNSQNSTQKNEFNINEIDESSENNKIYSILNSNFYLFEPDSMRDDGYQGIKLLEYDNRYKNCAKIYYISYDYTTDPSYEYELNIRDENGNSILIDEAGNTIEKDRLLLRNGVLCNNKKS